MHITSNSKSLLNEGRPNERKDEENSLKLAVLTVFIINDYLSWSIDLNITACIFAHGLI